MEAPFSRTISSREFWHGMDHPPVVSVACIRKHAGQLPGGHQRRRHSAHMLRQYKLFRDNWRGTCIHCFFGRKRAVLSGENLHILSWMMLWTATHTSGAMSDRPCALMSDAMSIQFSVNRVVHSEWIMSSKIY